MYQKHFGFELAPFKITPDPRLFFPGGNRGAVLQALVYAIANGEGIVKVVGEVGSGKTMLCRMLEQELPDNVEVVYLANPSLGPDDILHAIAFELKITTSREDSHLAAVHSLQEFLLEKHATNRRVVVFIEEAQGMPLATLEEIRLLSNLETSQDKLLQIVLFGQPELDDTLAAHEIRQLKERITYSFDLEPFKSDEIHEYINSRLRASGYKGPDLFETASVREIARASAGLLRRINILADKALLAAYADNATKVKRKHVERAAADSEFVAARPRWPLFAGAAGAIAALLLGVGVLLWWQDRPEQIAPLPAAAEAVEVPPQSPTITPRPAAPRPSNTAQPAPEPTVAVAQTTPEPLSRIADLRDETREFEENRVMSSNIAKSPIRSLPGLLNLESLPPDTTLLLDIKGLGRLMDDTGGTTRVSRD